MTGYGVYVHVPFCVRKCNYCSFVSRPISSLKSEVPSRYCAGVLAERRLLQPEFQEAFSSAPAMSVYIGGGTPTSLSEPDLLRLIDGVLEQAALSDDTEITVEANPATVSFDMLRRLIEAGVNRLSVGIQSFSDEMLKFLGRIHTAEQALDTVGLARKAGFSNLSVDLIFGIPGQSLDDWKRTLEITISLCPEHVSTYELSAEPGTRLETLVREGIAKMPDEELAVDMWELSHELLGQAGYEHYEISNFARPSFRCRHNLNYWRCGNYLGLGAAAHSHLDGLRWWNVGDPVEYCHKVESGSAPVAGLERLSSSQRATEKLMLALRTREGLDVKDIKALGVKLDDSWWNQVQTLCRSDLLRMDGTRIWPTPRGMLMNNVVSRMLAI